MPPTRRPADPHRACQECGADRTSAQARFCSGCGAPVVPVVATRPPHAPARGAPEASGVSEPDAVDGTDDPNDPGDPHGSDDTDQAAVDALSPHRAAPGRAAIGVVGVVVVAVAVVLGLRATDPTDPDPPDAVAVPDAEGPEESVDDAPGVSGAEPRPALACTPSGCERWRVDLEDRWTTLGVAEDVLVLLDRGAVHGGGWGAATDARDQLRLVALADGEDLLRTPLELTGVDGAPPGAARGLRLLEDAIVVALDGQVVLLGLDGGVLWAHTIEDGVATPLHATEERLLVEVTPDRPDVAQPRGIRVLDRADGQLVWEADTAALPGIDDEVVVLVEGEAPPQHGDGDASRVTVTGRALADGAVRWERPAAGADPTPLQLGVVLLHGAGAEGGDLLVRAADGAALVDLGRDARWVGSIRDGDGVLVLGAGPHEGPPGADHHGDGVAEEGRTAQDPDPDPIEVARVGSDGALRWRVELDGPAGQLRTVLERADRLVLIGDDGTTVTVDPATGATLEPVGQIPEDVDGETWTDEAGRRITRTGSGYTVTGPDGAVSITAPTPGASIAHHDPYLILDDHELLAVDPVAGDQPRRRGPGRG